MTNNRPSSLWIEYSLAVVSVALCTALSFAIVTRLALVNLVMIYLLGTLAVAARGHRGPAALASLLSVFCFDFFFVPPRFSLTVSDAQYTFTFVVMFITAMIISHLTIRLRSEATAAQQSEANTTLMHRFTEKLSAARGQDDVIRISGEKIQEILPCQLIFLMPDKRGRLKATSSNSSSYSDYSDEKQNGVAQWVFDKGEAAGHGERSLPAETGVYLPLQGAAGAVGVLHVVPTENSSLSIEQRKLLGSFSRQIALALEVDRLSETARAAQIAAETERMRSALLSSVSHDFRTPLTAIVGSASALLGNADIQKNPKSKELVETIQDEGERLSRQIQNLLDTTRLESGALQLRKERYPLEEIVGTALNRLEKVLAQRSVSVEIDPQLPPVCVDGLLLEQVFINLLENAVRHTTPSAAITVRAQHDGSNVAVSVIDNGPGLPPSDLERVFDKFYHDKSSPGAGLGLAICRAIVNVHGGRIWAENQSGGGAAFCFTLPLEPEHERR